MSALAPETRSWLDATGFAVRDEALWHMALTHGSTGEARDYQRLEFLGDRVLGLTIADWLYARSEGDEGDLAQRLNALVARQMCARQARAIGAPPHIRLGKQARDDGAADSDNVLGDIMESLLGAQFLEAGFDATRTLIQTIWRDAVEGRAGLAKHPKKRFARMGGRQSPQDAELQCCRYKRPRPCAALHRAREHSLGRRSGSHRQRQARCRNRGRAAVYGEIRVIEFAKHPSRLREGQRDLATKEPSRSGVGFAPRNEALAHPRPLPHAGGEI